VIDSQIKFAQRIFRRESITPAQAGVQRHEAGSQIKFAQRIFRRESITPAKAGVQFGAAN
jgi:hypothetical protein